MSPDAPPAGIDVVVTSLVSATSGRGLVDLQVGPTHVQIEPTKAREIAAMILESAEAAEGDAFVNAFMMEQIHMLPGQAARILQEFRTYRVTRAARERTDDGSTAGPRPPEPSAERSE